jgi:hypothetical protein
MRSNDRITQIAAVAAALLTLGELAAAAEPHQDQPRQEETQKPDAKNPPAKSPDRKGETLGGRLARNKGVIHPPSSQDPKMVKPPPSTPDSTPVIPPGGRVDPKAK